VESEWTDPDQDSDEADSHRMPLAFSDGVNAAQLHGAVDTRMIIAETVAFNGSPGGTLFFPEPHRQSTFQFCVIEDGAGVLNQSDSSTFSDCTFRNNTWWGLDCPAGSADIENCTAINNLESGINAPGRKLTNSLARFNGGWGLVWSVHMDCEAYGNVEDGLIGETAESG
jgi:hypothetical protein